jgi:hypothetical protein
MAKGNVPKSIDGEKARDVARELFKQFENLPAEVRHVLTAQASSPDVLMHVAGGIQHTLDEIRGDANAAELRHAATGLRAHTSHGSRTLCELEALAGRLEGLAWARDAFEQAEHFATE